MIRLPVKFDIRILLVGLLLFIIMTGYYGWMIYNKIETDVQQHAQYAHALVNDDAKLPPNFLYFVLVSVLAGFSKYKIAFYSASVFLLSFAVTIKFYINAYYIKKYTKIDHTNLITLFSIFLIFIFCFPGIDFFKTKVFLLGQLAPNVWHNSTVIFLFPFSILLFFKSYELLYENDETVLGQVTSLVFINALIKPSFLFTLIPTFFLLFFFQKRNFSKLSEFKKTLPFILAILFIGVEYVIIYQLNYDPNTAGVDTGSDVIIAPFEIWKHYSANIFFSFIFSLLFPLIYVVLTKARVLKNRLVLFASINFLIGLFIYIFFAEGGYRKLHGNFGWQIVTANYLLFFSFMLYLINDIKKSVNIKPKQVILCILFLLHFVWGLIYWLKIIVVKSHS